MQSRIGHGRLMSLQHRAGSNQTPEPDKKESVRASRTLTLQVNRETVARTRRRDEDCARPQEPFCLVSFSIGNPEMRLPH
jgi:hypothetical protein